MKLRTAEDVRAALRAQGISVTQWAVANGFAPNLVFEILAGKRQCVRGKSHAIAIKLGMKEGAICTTPGRALERPMRRSGPIAAEV